MTLTEAQTRLAAAETAYDNALSSFSVSYQDKSVVRHKLQTYLEAIEYWDKKVKYLQAQANGATNPGVRIATWS